jgi:hypothetical protein
MRSTIFIGALLFFAGAAVGAAWPRPARHEAAAPASSSDEPASLHEQVLAAEISANVVAALKDRGEAHATDAPEIVPVAPVVAAETVKRVHHDEYDAGRRFADQVISRGELDDMDLVKLRELAQGLSGDDALALRLAIAKAINDGRLQPQLAPGNQLMF